MLKQKGDAFLFSLQPQVKSSKPNTHQYANMRDRGNVEQIKARVDELVNFLNPDNRLSDASDNMSPEDFRVCIQQINFLARHFTLHQLGPVLNGLAELNRGNYRFREELKKLDINNLIWALDQGEIVNILDVVEILRGCSRLYDRWDLSWNPLTLTRWVNLNIHSLSAEKALDMLQILAKLGYKAQNAEDAPFIKLIEKLAKRAKSGIENFTPKELVTLAHSLAKTGMFSELFDRSETGEKIKRRLGSNYSALGNKAIHALLQVDLFCRCFDFQPFFDNEEEAKAVRASYSREASAPSYFVLEVTKELEEMGYSGFEYEFALDPARIVDFRCHKIVDGVMCVLFGEGDGPGHNSIIKGVQNSATRERDRINLALLSDRVPRARELGRRICYAVIPWGSKSSEWNLSSEVASKEELKAGSESEPGTPISPSPRPQIAEVKEEFESRKSRAAKPNKKEISFEEELAEAMKESELKESESPTDQPERLKQEIDRSRVEAVKDILAAGNIDVSSIAPGTDLTFPDYAFSRISSGKKAKQLAANKVIMKIFDALVAATAEESVSERSKNEDSQRAFYLALNEELYNAASYIFSKYTVRIHSDQFTKIIKSNFVPLITKTAPALSADSFTDNEKNNLWQIALEQSNATEIAAALGNARILPACDAEGLELAAKILHLGISKQNEAIVSAIVSAFTWRELVRSNKMPEPFLHYVASYGNENILEMLLQAGASVDIQERGTGNVTAFFHACRCGQEAIVVRLADIARGLPRSPNSPASHQNLLHSWLMERHERSSTYLIHTAVLMGHPSIIKLLCDLAEGLGVKRYYEFEGNNGAAPLHYALYLLNADVVRCLTSVGANVERNFPTDGASIPYMAAREGDISIIRALCEAAEEQGIEYYLSNSRCRDGATALHGAALDGRVEMVSELISQGLPVNAKNLNGITALYAAAEGGHLEVVKILLENGAEINATNIKEETAICVAVNKLHPEVCEYLIKAGADLGIKERDNFLLEMAMHSINSMNKIDPELYQERGKKTFEVIAEALKEERRKLASTTPSPDVQPTSHFQLASPLLDEKTL